MNNLNSEIVIEEKMEENWDELVSIGMQAREAGDNSQWILGDLALKILKNYGSLTKDGKNVLEKFSANVGVSRNTLRRYKVVSQAWPPEKRDMYMSHRHHMILASRENRFDLIIRASDESWSTECLKKELKKMDGKWDANLAAASMTFTKKEVEEIIRWSENVKTNDMYEITMDKVSRLYKKTMKGN